MYLKVGVLSTGRQLRWIGVTGIVCCFFQDTSINLHLNIFIERHVVHCCPGLDSVNISLKVSAIMLQCYRMVQKDIIGLKTIVEASDRVVLTISSKYIKNIRRP